MKTYIVWGIILIVLTSVVEAKKTVGKIENVAILPEQLWLEARLDTGAKSSSLSAINIEEFDIDGATWVAFQVVDRKTGVTLKSKLPLKRYANIKKRKNDAELFDIKSYNVRPVVVMPIWLGNEKFNIEVNLVDRRHFEYPMLIGRDAIIQFDAVVDPSLTKVVNQKK